MYVVLQFSIASQKSVNVECTHENPFVQRAHASQLAKPKQPKQPVHENILCSTVVPFTSTYCIKQAPCCNCAKRTRDFLNAASISISPTTRHGIVKCPFRENSASTQHFLFEFPPPTHKRRVKDLIEK